MFNKIIDVLTDWKVGVALGVVWIILAVIGTVFQITVSPFTMSIIMITLAVSHFQGAYENR